MTFMLRATRAAVLSAIFCAASPVFSQQASPTTTTEAAIATDRPGNGNAPTTVAQGQIQIESSIGYALDASSSGDVHLASFPTALRLGILPFLELRAGTGIFGIHTGTDESTVSSTDTFVGTKLQALESDGWRPSLGIMVDVALPSGRGLFTADVVNPEARVAASWALPGGFGMLCNAGADIPKDSEGRFARFVYVANLNYGPPILDGRLVFFVESFGRIPLARHRDPLVQIDLGAAFLLEPSWQLDFFTQHALTSESPELQVALGLSTRI